MKKRILGLVLCGIMTASLFGCGGAADSASSAASSAAASSAAVSEAASEAEAASSEAASSASSEASADAAADAGEMKDWEQAYVDDGYIPTGDGKYTFAFIAQDFKDTFSQAVTSGIEDYVKEKTKYIVK